MIKALLIASGLVFAAEGACAEGVSRLGWLSGCWMQVNGDRVVEETWTSSAGGMLMGMGKTLSAGKLRSYEFMRIEAIDGTLTFTALPSGQAPASFPVKSQGPTEIVFENTAHDFPQTVRYWREEAGVSAPISGPVNGQMNTLGFAYRRCAP